MTENVTEQDSTTTEQVETAETTETGIRDLKRFEKGTWQHSLVVAGRLLDRISGDRKKSSQYLWSATTDAIEDWLNDKADTDVHGEHFYADLLDILGVSRKGDVSKMRTVALAVANNGLVTSQWPNLSKAYGEALRLTKTVKEQQTEDDAAEEVIETIAAEAPKSTSTVDGAAALLLSKGLDGAVVAILDVLNGSTPEINNEAAHRAFMRAVSSEIASRVQAKAQAEAQAKKDASAKAAAERKAAAEAKAAERAANAPAATKAKPAATATKAKAKPVSASTGDPNKKALPKAAPVKGKPAPAKAAQAEPVQAEAEAEDMFSDLDADETVALDQPVKPAPVKRAAPVKR